MFLKFKWSVPETVACVVVVVCSSSENKLPCLENRAAVIFQLSFRAEMKVLIIILNVTFHALAIHAYISWWTIRVVYAFCKHNISNNYKDNQIIRINMNEISSTKLYILLKLIPLFLISHLPLHVWHDFLQFSFTLAATLVPLWEQP